MQKNQRIKD